MPPGLSPLTFSPRAVERVRTRSTPPQSWYLDLGLIGDYVGGARKYHHTAPTAMIVALHAGLGAVLDEGLEQSWARHRAVGDRLQAGLVELGLVADRRGRPPAPTADLGPAARTGLDEGVLRKALLTGYGIEVGGGLGEFAGVAWRIGLMGHSARERSVTTLLGALREQI